MLTSYTVTTLLSTMPSIHSWRLGEFPPLRSATLPPGNGPLSPLQSWPSRRSVMWSQYRMCLKTAFRPTKVWPMGNWESKLNNNVLLCLMVTIHLFLFVFRVPHVGNCSGCHWHKMSLHQCRLTVTLQRPVFWQNLQHSSSCMKCLRCWRKSRMRSQCWL